MWRSEGKGAGRGQTPLLPGLAEFAAKGDDVDGTAADTRKLGKQRRCDGGGSVCRMALWRRRARVWLPPRRRQPGLFADTPSRSETTLDPSTAAERLGSSDGSVSPLEAWWAVEDLWLRFAALGMLVIEDGETTCVIVRGLRRTADDDLGGLRSVALDAETYAWNTDERRGAIVQRLEYRGDDLVCTLPERRVVLRWPDGIEVACILEARVKRLRYISASAVKARSPIFVMPG